MTDTIKKMDCVVVRRNGMRKFTRLLAIVSSPILFSFPVSAAVPNTDNPSTFLGPIGRFGFTSTFNDTTAGSVAGEIGPRNYRLGGTIGVTDFGSNRFKLSAEYLWQKINYDFFAGNTYQWVSQGALGGDYQYLFEDYEYNPQFDINAYVSRAPSKSIGNATGTFINSSGVSTAYTDIRHIAGSNAYGISPGFNVEPWDGGKLGFNVIYDNVRYKTIYVSSKDAKGIGGIAQFNQTLSDNTQLGVQAAVRRPFNNYQANLAFTVPTCYGTWLLGINGAYTIGKNTLPSTYNVGLSADYLLDQTDSMGMTQKQATESFLGWIAKPGVYMPQVLAVPEDGGAGGGSGGGSGPCLAPTFSGQLGPNFGGGVFLTPFGATDISGNFTGSGLTYTINLNGNPNAGGLTLTQAGILSDPDFDVRTGLSITASNACGSATSNLFDLNSGA